MRLHRRTPFPRRKRCAHFQCLGVGIETLRALREINFNSVPKIEGRTYEWSPYNGRRFSSFPQRSRLIYGPAPRRKASGTGCYTPSHGERARGTSGSRREPAPFATVLQSAGSAVSPTTAGNVLLSVGPALLRWSRSRTRRNLDRGKGPNLELTLVTIFSIHLYQLSNQF